MGLKTVNSRLHVTAHPLMSEGDIVRLTFDIGNPSSKQNPLNGAYWYHLDGDEIKRILDEISQFGFQISVNTRKQFVVVMNSLTVEALENELTFSPQEWREYVRLTLSGE